jgi:hypothetical protein
LCESVDLKPTIGPEAKTEDDRAHDKKTALEAEHGIEYSESPFRAAKPPDTKGSYLDPHDYGELVDFESICCEL